VATPPQPRELSPLGRRARTLFRTLFVVWVVSWAGSFKVDAVTDFSHVVALLAMLCGLAWLVSERGSGSDG